MPISPAENAFRKGKAALSDGKPKEAMILFESAIRLQRDRNPAQPRMIFLSYFGLSTALADRATPQAIQACEMAAKQEFFNAELQLNLGKVYLLADKTTKALAAFEHGLRLAPRNRALKIEMNRVERRKSPPIPWMDRNHPLNCWLGKMRASLVPRPAR